MEKDMNRPAITRKQENEYTMLIGSSSIILLNNSDSSHQEFSQIVPLLVFLREQQVHITNVMYTKIDLVRNNLF
jgi:hypothetical protein